MKIADGMSARFAARVRRLRADFMATLPERAVALKQLSEASTLDLERLEKLRIEVHQLKGSAGMYQLESVFKAARDAESIVDQMLEARRAGQSSDVRLEAALEPLLGALSAPNSE